MREAYDSLEPEVLVLIGALTPLSEAVQHSGGTDLIAGGLVASACGRGAAAGAGRADGHVDGLLAVPAQRADGAGAGPDRGVGRAAAAPAAPTRS